MFLSNYVYLCFCPTTYNDPKLPKLPPPMTHAPQPSLISAMSHWDLVVAARRNNGKTLRQEN